MKRFVFYIIILLLLNGCKTKEPIIIYRDSIRIHTLRDSVYLQRYDSIYIHQKGDTVRIEKYKTIFKDKYRTITDTLTINKEKRIQVPVPVIKKVVPAWCWWLLGFNVLILLIIIVRSYIEKKFGI